MGADVLYVTFDGILQPLAYSQVARVVAALGRRGLRYHLLSLERPADWANARLRDRARAFLSSADVAWTALEQSSMTGASRAGPALARAVARALAIVRREKIALVHARGYHGAAVARAIRQLTGTPYLFDARGYWIEERTGPGALFATPTRYAAGKLVEQALFRGADAVVTLTELQAADVAAGLFGPPPRALAVIPTCADYDAFFLRDERPSKRGLAGSIPSALAERLADKTVVAIVGALNGTYLVAETLALARRITEQGPPWHVLVLSAQAREYEAALASAGARPEGFTVASAAHEDMPAWLQWIDWGLLLVPETAANRAKMPTKLAEFFASGVAPVFYGCNSDAARWVERAGSGLVLSSVSATELDGAARCIAETPTDPARLRRAREITAEHFSLSRGVDRYAELVGGMLRAFSKP